MEFLFVLIVIAVILNRSLRVIRKGHSLIVFQDGRPVKTIDSNSKRMAFLLPFAQTSKLVDTSKRISSIPDLFDDVDKKTPLVRGSLEWSVTEPAKAVNNSRLNDDVNTLIAIGFQRVLADATLEQCLKQKEQIEIKVIEISKLKLATLGIAITKIDVVSFPRHRQLLYQISTMPFVVYWQIVEELQ